jgi:homoserine dehydrogenase
MSTEVKNKIGPTALFGFGTVGRAVFDILDKMGLGSNIKYIVVRDKQKHIDKKIEGIVDTLFEDDMKIALERLKEVDGIIEVMGGTDDAWTVVKTALEMNKKVTTANKALVSTYMNELQVLLKEIGNDEDIRSFNWDYLHFEAAVAGGIPIIRSLLRDVQDVFRQNMQGFTTKKLYAILNGTSNFILTKMEQGMSYVNSLQLAQNVGYAEADPSADVKGYDARAKIHILEQILFSTNRKADAIVCQGIEDITNIDFEYASLLKGKIKLVATTAKNSSGVSTWVMPTLVPSYTDLAKTDGVRNIVCVDHPFLGTLSYSGEGAGGYATAHSVVSDIFDLSIVYPLGSLDPEKTSSIENDFEIPFYLRITVIDCIGIIADIGTLCSDLNISVDAVIQKPMGPKFDFVNDDLTFIVTTNVTPYKTVQLLKGKIEEMEWNKKPVFIMAMH